jgi:hypothetical protein
MIDKQRPILCATRCSDMTPGELSAASQLGCNYRISLSSKRREGTVDLQLVYLIAVYQ